MTATAAPRSRRLTIRPGLERLIYPLGLAISIIIVWEIATRGGLIKRILLAPFSSVVGSLVDGFFIRGWIWPHLGATLSVWIVGYLLAVIAGIAVGLLVGMSSRASKMIQPWLNGIYVTPDIALVPIFIIWFGIGFEFKIWYVFLAGFFFVAVNTLTGVKASEGRFIRVARHFGASRRKMIATVVLPGSLPYIITGLRQAAGRSLVGVVAAEFVASNTGIGFMVSVAGQTFDTARVMAGIFILITAGIGTAEILRRVERRFDRWRV
ncbi:MAG TPA: ABC transporter permease [Candidatus Limnocylindrales bacterium]|nr:ABC transporter permease [Candidatus Limnocylindrales bacterium]